MCKRSFGVVYRDISAPFFCIHVEKKEDNVCSQVDHAIQNPLRLVLEEDGFVMATSWTCVFRASWQCRVLHELINDARLLLGNAHQIIAENHLVLCFLLIGTVATGIEQRLRRAVDVRIEKIVAAERPPINLIVTRVRGYVTPPPNHHNRHVSPFCTEVERCHRLREIRQRRGRCRGIEEMAMGKSQDLLLLCIQRRHAHKSALAARI